MGKIVVFFRLLRKALEEKLGADEFEKLAAEVAPKAEEIVRKMLERASA